jgi:hypothetical protein
MNSGDLTRMHMSYQNIESEVHKCHFENKSSYPLEQKKSNYLYTNEVFRCY